MNTKKFLKNIKRIPLFLVAFFASALAFTLNLTLSHADVPAGETVATQESSTQNTTNSDPGSSQGGGADGSACESSGGSC